MAVQQRGWSVEVAHDLAVELGVSVRTVHRYWEKARRWTRQTLRAGDIEKWRAQQIQALTNIATEARMNKDYTAAVRAIDVQAKIIGTISPLNLNVAARVEHVAVVIPQVLDAVSGQPRQITLDEIQSELGRQSAVDTTAEVVEAGPPSGPSRSD